MQIHKLLPILFCPFALASPEPNPLPQGVAPRAPDSAGSGILADLPQIVDGIKQLLDKQTLDNLDTIIGGGATLLSGDTPNNLKKLLSAKNIDKLQDVIDNAHTLLSAQFVNQTTTLIDDATPLVAAVSKLLGGVLTSTT